MACTAPLSILKGAVKGHTPANEAILKRTMIDRSRKIVEHGVSDSAPWHKEFPLSKGDYNNVVGGPATKEYRDKSLRDYAIARFAAIQLAWGKGLISDADDTDEWEGSPIQKNDNRKNPIIWFNKSVLLFESADKFAPYGRRAGRAHEGVKTVSITRRAALHYSEITARDFENVGDCPFASEYYPIFVGEPKRVAHANENVAASAKGKSDMLDLWLVDTGCGHDLVSNTNVKFSGGETRRLEKAVIFQTSNGDTPSTRVAPISFRGLNETIEPYVLKETPSVISVGDRTMNKGYSFVWKAGCNPCLITPDEKIITFEVIRDIPYLRRGSDLCQPRDATDEDFRFDALPSHKEVAADEDVDAERSANEDGENPTSAPEESEENVPVRNLREEAMSMRHLLTHKPFNIHCDACNLGKMRKAKKFVGSYQESRQPTAWLDLVTADHLVAKNGGMEGTTGDFDALVVKDLYSKIKVLLLVRNKTAEQAIRVLRYFFGNNAVNRFYSDNAPELELACAALGIVHEKSRAGAPQNTSVIERTNLDILEGIRTTLICAGFPEGFWPFAARHFCFL